MNFGVPAHVYADKQISALYQCLVIQLYKNNQSAFGVEIGKADFLNQVLNLTCLDPRAQPQVLLNLTTQLPPYCSFNADMSTSMICSHKTKHQPPPAGKSCFRLKIKMSHCIVPSSMLFTKCDMLLQQTTTQDASKITVL